MSASKVATSLALSLPKAHERHDARDGSQTDRRRKGGSSALMPTAKAAQGHQGKVWVRPEMSTSDEELPQITGWTVIVNMKVPWA